MKTSTLRCMAFLCMLLITNLLLVSATSAQTNTWDGSNNSNWNTGANWSLNHVPTSSEDVVININGSISVDASPTINSLTINNNAIVSFTSSGSARTITIDNTGSVVAAGSSLTLNGSTGSGTRTMTIAFSGTSRTFSIAGTVIVSATGAGGVFAAANSSTTVTGKLQNTGGTITSTASNLSFSSGGIYDHAVDGGTIATATWNTGSTCLISVNAGSAPGGLAPTGGFANFTWDCAVGTSATSLAGLLTTVNGDFTIAHTGTAGSLRLVNIPGGSNLVTAIGGDFSMTGGTFYIVGTNSSTGSETMKVTGDVSISGGALQMSGNSLIGALEVKGNFSHTAGTITESSTGSGLITFNGSSAQTLTGGGTVSNTINYVINNTSSTGVTLLTAYTIPTGCSLTMTDGNIYSTATNLLSFSDGATVTGASNNSYVDGPVKKIGNDNFTFPLGKSGIYGYLSISAPTAATDAFTAEYFRGTPVDYASRSSQISQLSKVDYWRLDRSAGSSFVNVTLSWSATSADASITAAYGANSTLARHNTSISKWNAYSNSGGFSGSFATGGTVTWTNVNSYDDFFAIGLAPAGTSLPVKFTGVDVKKEGNAARVTWNVATEENLSAYVVEKSVDGTNFSAIASIGSKNYSSYSYLDGPFVTGKVFYRVKSVDLDGKYSYSPVVSLSDDKSNVQLKAFPIPAQNQITIQHPAAGANAKISLSSADGRMMKSVIVTKGAIQTSIDLSSLMPGFYTLQFANGDGSTASTIKIIKQ